MNTYNNLPLYTLDIDDALDSELEVYAVAIVDRPAIRVGFHKFSDALPLRLMADDARRIVTGPLLIPDCPTYRHDERGEYYVSFGREVIERIALKYFRRGYANHVNLMHDPGAPLDGVTLFESFLTDASRGVSAPAGFEALPEGTWFVSYKVANDAVWAAIRNGGMTGFSIEGLFQHVRGAEDVFAGRSMGEIAQAALEALGEMEWE